MKIASKDRYCLNPDCNRRIIGRSDKRFCDVECKNQYHRLHKSVYEEGVERVIRILKKNREVLREVKGEKDSIRISPEKLVAKGYDPDYLTQSRKIGTKGYFYCFDYGYREEDNGELTIVKAFKWG